MDETAILAAIRSGKTSAVFLALATVADEAFLVHTPDDTATVGAVRVGAMTIGMGLDGSISAHGHADAETAATCLARNKALASLGQMFGYRLVPDEEVKALMAVSASAPVIEAVPDGVRAYGTVYYAE